MLNRTRAAGFRPVRLAAIVMFALMFASPASGEAVLYRIFLHDGSTLVSYGDFARVAGRVVFSIPLSGLDAETPRLELVSIAESSVDWEKTDSYAEAARARRYAESRGEADFSRLSSEVALALNQIALTEDPARRVKIAEAARAKLAEWPSRNYQYRAHDVSQLSSLLDEVISELRVAAGMGRFELSFVAATSPPPPVALMRPPSLRESIEQALSVARITPEATERISLLEGVIEVLEPSAGETWADALHARASADLIVERKTERDYGDLAARTLVAAEDRLRRADVKGIQSLIKSVLRADDRLGRRRPQATAALLSTLDSRLDQARRFRLARDAWAARQDTLRAYRRRIRSATDRFQKSAELLQDIRQLAGPSPELLERLAESVAAGSRDLLRVYPTPDLKAVHTMFISAFQMAGHAVVARRTALTSTDMDLAWQASSAAAGALLMFERANEELQRLATPPRL
ncbi:MAG TPA: hypothetical protein VLD67_01885 [Vicinamibacterales bacterium]|nr:hypothetical protein [Vicinamibacterales bacterium]